MVAIRDAEKEEFLRPSRSLIQTIGRAARHVRGKAILYGDRITTAMQYALDETERRRARQTVYNRERGITPQSIRKAGKDLIEGMPGAPAPGSRAWPKAAEEVAEYETMPAPALAKLIARLEKQMYQHARNLEFEQAAALRDRITRIRDSKFGLIGQVRGNP